MSLKYLLISTAIHSFTCFTDEAAREALTDMPPRQEEELDHVTLHNSALMNMDEDPTTGFEKLNFLLQQTPCPPEAFSNLLLLYVKYEYYDLAADLLAENQHIAYKSLNPVCRLEPHLSIKQVYSPSAPISFPSCSIYTSFWRPH